LTRRLAGNLEGRALLDGSERASAARAEEVDVTAVSYPLGRSSAPPLRRPSGVPEQLLVREVNDRALQIALRDAGARVPEVIEVICECERRGCPGRFEMALDQYEAVRRFPTRFVIKRGHPVGEDERVAADEAVFVVVEKTGRSAGAAIRLDPRRRQRSVEPDA
jgi:hypothetical protein